MHFELSDKEKLNSVRGYQVAVGMTMISQDEIVANAKTVTKGLEALRTEHETILGGIKASLATVEQEEEGAEGSLIQEKCGLMQRSLDMITLGLGEAHLMGSLATHLQNVEAEKQKLRSQVLETPLLLVVSNDKVLFR